MTATLTLAPKGNCAEPPKTTVDFCATPLEASVVGVVPSPVNTSGTGTDVKVALTESTVKALLATLAWSVSV